MPPAILLKDFDIATAERFQQSDIVGIRDIYHNGGGRTVTSKKARNEMQEAT
jgi:hypothetical protein